MAGLLGSRWKSALALAASTKSESPDTVASPLASMPSPPCFLPVVSWTLLPTTKSDIHYVDKCYGPEDLKRPC